MSTEASITSQSKVIRFIPNVSSPDLTFWIALSNLKLDSLGLDDSPFPVNGGYYIPYNSGRRNSKTNATLPPRVLFNHAGLGGDSGRCRSSGINDNSNPFSNERIVLPGSMRVLNTPESLKKLDKQEYLKSLRTDLLKWCRGESDDSSPLGWTCLSYLDLKKHAAVYWFAFPALAPRVPFVFSNSDTNGLPSVSSLQDCLGSKKINVLEMLEASVATMRQNMLEHSNNGNSSLTPYFIVLGLTEFICDVSNSGANNSDSSTKLTAASIECLPLSHKAYFDLSPAKRSKAIFAFFDPCSSSTHPGWPGRNLLAYLNIGLGIKCPCVRILCYRPSVWRRITSVPSLVAVPVNALPNSPNRSKTRNTFEMKPEDDEEEVGGVLVDEPPKVLSDDESNLSPAENLFQTSGNDQIEHTSILLHVSLSDVIWDSSQKKGTTDKQDLDDDSIPVVGWEMNSRGRPGPRSVNLASVLDKTKIAEQSVDLNLKLMRWRLIPTLDTTMLSSTRCLLLGAGTLGCGVARTLLAWGVRTITFVDNGRVSYSNPVRQSLFELSDCGTATSQGSFKATTAATALKKIFPGVVSEGFVMTIPMPGHSLSDNAAAKRDIELLEKLICSHDIIFLLTDTRESRWLPTLIASANDKILINTALGLDSWLVMRHGCSPDRTVTSNNPRLGCYFCNDIVAPENSMKERTLDQQCTVTRPGLAPIASALAVELMVALLHHKDRHLAKADSNDGVDRGGPLGIIPHQVRGQISTYGIMTPKSPSFDCCTACSPKVVNLYRRERFDFVKRVTANTSYLEEVSGLADFRNAAETVNVDWEDDDDSDESM